MINFNKQSRLTLFVVCELVLGGGHRRVAVIEWGESANSSRYTPFIGETVWIWVELCAMPAASRAELSKSRFGAKRQNNTWKGAKLGAN